MGVGRHQSCARGLGTEKIVHKKLKKTQNSVGRQGMADGCGASQVLCAWAGDGEAVLSAVLSVEVFLVDGIE